VKTLNTRESKSIIDTGCGSAGFTMHSLFHVWKAIFKEIGKPKYCADCVQDKVIALAVS